MRIKTGLSLALFVATAGLGVGWILFSPTRQAEPPEPLPTTRPEASEGEKSRRVLGEVEQLRTQISQLQARIDSLSAAERSAQSASKSSSKGSADGSAAGSERAADGKDGEAAERAHTRKLAGFLDQQFRQEGSDGSWSPLAQAEISRRFQSEGGRSGPLRDALCQASMCRIDATHPDSDAEQSFLVGLVGLSAFQDSEAFTERTERSDGSVETRTFISRAGYRLPEPEADF